MMCDGVQMLHILGVWLGDGVLLRGCDGECI